MIDTDEYGEQDWLIRWYDEKAGSGDGMDYDNFWEAFEEFNAGVAECPNLEWTLAHYYNYKPDGEGGWHEPTENMLLYWEQQDDVHYPLAEQIQNMLSLRDDTEWDGKEWRRKE